MPRDWAVEIFIFVSALIIQYLSSLHVNAFFLIETRGERTLEIPGSHVI